jgi:hypothetical protein
MRDDHAKYDRYDRLHKPVKVKVAVAVAPSVALFKSTKWWVKL